MPAPSGLLRRFGPSGLLRCLGPSACCAAPGPSGLLRCLGPSGLGAAAGIVGPVAFTSAWIVASLRQTGHSAVAVQLSGLAAPDARGHGIMIAGFLALGACSVAFDGSLHRALGGSGRRAADPRQAGVGVRFGRPSLHWVRPGPGPDAGPRQAGVEVRVGRLSLRWIHPTSRGSDVGSPEAGFGPRLIQWAGALTIAAGLLRRDHMLLEPPGAAVGESWHNHAHDLVSSIIYVTLVVAPMLLALRFRGDPRWRRLWVPLLAGSAATAGLLGVFGSPAAQSWDPVLQRVAVSIPLAMVAAIAVRLLTLAAGGAGSGISGLVPVTGRGSGPAGRPARSGCPTAR